MARKRDKKAIKQPPKPKAERASAKQVAPPAPPDQAEAGARDQAYADGYAAGYTQGRAEGYAAGHLDGRLRTLADLAEASEVAPGSKPVVSPTQLVRRARASGPPRPDDGAG